ncbi:MAG: hypothetical protein E6G73_11710 [Alphaproteobacteria bacterium]|nr:MAG: hypothetical protein E6G73_11710 [Alphaproteobacteria bacterium]
MAGDWVHLASVHAAADAALEITTATGGPGMWLGGPSTTLLVRAPARGGTALVTAYLGHDPAAPPLALTIRRVDAATEPPARTVSFAARTESAPAPEIPLEIVLHIRGRGDVYFFGSGWAGRVGPGSWIEAFTILPRHERAAAAIEYKGLSANGVETAWLPAGSVCGTTGRNTPLLGFAVRQKAGVAGARFDCEYSGSFESGAVSGPARNGAPCRSVSDNDPLEGLQLCIIDRSAAG